MTSTVTDSRALWSTMPGWGIVADLTPPEILQNRRIAALKRNLVLTLVGLLVLILIGGGFAFLRKHAAQNSLDASQQHSIELNTELAKYSDVTTIQGTVAQVQSQVATLLATDIDFPKLLTDVQRVLPPSVSISQLSLQVASPGGGSTALTTTGAGVLDPGKHLHIGGATITGSASKLTDVSSYVEKLAELKGIVEPYPVTNSQSDSGVNFSIQLTMTDELYTNRYAKPAGVK